jgi:hypothetical protein
MTTTTEQTTGQLIGLADWQFPPAPPAPGDLRLDMPAAARHGSRRPRLVRVRMDVARRFGRAVERGDVAGVDRWQAVLVDLNRGRLR